MIFENELSDAWDVPDETVNVSVPISMIRHPSGEIHIVVIDLMPEQEHDCLAERRIRFSAQAAAQLRDAIGGMAQSGHVLFGDERPATATLH
ncbi:hypothetical protein [Trinickia dinghuensis]|uniref:Uncharacterized protein n=1 Tax=Trinickia dinghuensis TaxID=2291023 RepID=A0A3D8JY10_9BURK|nr:hypothetical protein [Trinickia dinghuensis]RDU97997.1 hypothetical protein DWV00_15845 [Trinickia dinghuensis]